MSSDALRQMAPKWRKVFAIGLLTASLAAMLLASFLAGPAMADDSGAPGCCICDCNGDAATSGLPDNAVCTEAIDEGDCMSICIGMECSVDQYVPESCSEISGCAAGNSGETVAPTASPIAMAALALLLAFLGLRTLPVARQS